ncbi:helix-turn-helix domain-containing protein [Maridesulfovibrio salexigens]|uniref:Transcriptional regulator, AraC family n=1 Tax=Maridesulfovibrio salexigens (strain ATCC 14822 / DSM 2638 / NCIMB 8403 / VKM B-1763) TaxID=526222 RepID=C6BZV3_MARSD|nr:AraC family transcriptional regulator [Maridesulfovibrio salexigens]ACS79010.1 transcriptional regulator, AraC family [Maridesulfovibrio salexigens DSM 2638]
MAIDDKLIYSSPVEGLEVLSCSSGREFKSHLHDGYVLWLNSESGEKYCLNGCSDILQPGSISIIEPETVHSNSPCCTERRHLRSFYFSEKFVRSLNYKLLGDENVPSPFRNILLENKQLWQNLSVLHHKLLSPVETLETDEAILSVLSGLYRHAGDGTIRPGSEDRRVSMIVDYLHAHAERNLSLAELADLAGCTEFHLIRIFRSHKGMTPHSFLIQLRLEKARAMIATNSPIADTAALCGFSDQSHLTRLFKIRYGLTPRQYQKASGGPPGSKEPFGKGVSGLS